MNPNRPSSIIVVAILGLAVMSTTADAGMVIGTNSGIFLNATPGTVFTGVGTSHFTYGTGVGTGPNSLDYSALNPINSTTETPFTLGRLTYFNGITTGATPTNVDVKIHLDLTQPGLVSQDFTFTLNFVITPNTGTADENADYVFVPSSYSNSTFMAGGQTYTLKLLGFGNVAGDGFLVSNSTELHVREGGMATADLMGVVTTNLSSVPEPSSLALCGIVGTFGLLVAGRHRKWS